MTMPKAKPTQVIVHRIELQQSERETLELAVAGNVATNAVSAAGAVFSGMGSMLAPFAPAFGALTAMWIGDRTLDLIREDGERRKQQIEDEYAESKPTYDAIISAWLNSKYSEGGWDAVCSTENIEGLMFDQLTQFSTFSVGGFASKGGLGQRIPQWYFDEFIKFLNTVCASTNLGDETPAELWVQWMDEETYGQAAYYADTGGSRWDAFWKGIGTL